MREAVARLDPHAEDMYTEAGTLLRRLQSSIDKELMRWTSGLVQPVGVSGDAVMELAPEADDPAEDLNTMRRI